jgi:hypothetical protein
MMSTRFRQWEDLERGSPSVSATSTLAGRPSTEHICQYSSAEDFRALGHSCAGNVEY